ncbi:hypothetical protein [Nocardia sp. NPDC059691]|uniref:hypothetical protein n=1 Tax=unclassified Nocardia TaxID=2637762 RepID=UPI0036A60DE5
MDSGWTMDLATRLAVAKSRQDVAAAVRLMHGEMVLEAPAFGLCAQSGVSTDVVRQKLFGGR